MTIVGRVQAVDDALVVPTLDGLLLVNGSTGQLDHHLKIDAAGNPLAVGAQLILAGGDELEVYMSLRRAEEMLRERIASSSVDPEPAMSLLQLGLRVGKLDMALEGAELALDAIERRPVQASPTDLRRELFDMLLEIHRRRIASTDDEAECYLEFAPDERCEAYRFSLAYDHACEIRLHDVALYAPKAGADG